ncbi:flavin reductase family protein [Rhodococcus sp. ACPA1]|uniref:flavin reductase family protein n=1 Tax=Rhodococcus sp. ACPA1 TaxID=2028572 RepID=UPI000BB10DE4|nr:flavin reductase family protein [Rhodococcus sp. ACPA1]PBC47188.1 flavin reductase [Rhodococcus sp. ACPA1]
MTASAIAAESFALSDEFRRAFRRHPAGVAIVTTQGIDGPVGMTISSVFSVSASPPILGFSLQSEEGAAAVIRSAPSFLVHLLDTPNLTLAQNFAHGVNRFKDGTSWARADTGEPLLHDVDRVLRCTPLTATPAGTAVVLTASILAVRSSGFTASSLVYHERAFHSTSSLSALPA